MNRDEESFDRQGFEEAITALTSRGKILAIQQASRETVNAEISVCYSKLQGFKHKIYFIIHPRDNVSLDSKAKLGLKIQILLSYEEISVLNDSSLEKASFDSNYSPFTRISSENVVGVRNFVAEYTRYIGENPMRHASPVYEDFVELLKESDSTEQEKLLRRLAQDCEILGIDLDVQVKKSRFENM